MLHLTSQTTRPDYFIADDRFFGAADAIAALTACPIMGYITRDQIITVLVEHDILPKSVRADVLAAYTEQAEADSARSPSGCNSL